MMNADRLSQSMGSAMYKPASTLRMMWLIAWRQAVEAVRTRTTVIMISFLLAFLTVMVLIVLGPLTKDHSSQGKEAAGLVMAFLLALMGFMFGQSSIGVASGVFAGDKERGCLLPLLATPASNTAIFAGKVLGALLPGLLYIVIGIAVYFIEIALFFGPGTLGLLNPVLGGLILVLVVAETLLGVALASLISSRVSTFQSAQTYSSLILTILSLGVSFLIFLMATVGLWVFALVVVGVVIADVLLIYFAAATWQREEVMAKQ